MNLFNKSTLKYLNILRYFDILLRIDYSLPDNLYNLGIYYVKVAETP